MKSKSRKPTTKHGEKRAGKPTPKAVLAPARGSVMIPFVNNKGMKMEIPGHLTIGDLTKMGLKAIKLVPNGTPIPDGWWQDRYSPNAADQPQPPIEIGKL